MSYVETIFVGRLAWVYVVLLIVSFCTNAAIIFIFHRISERGRSLNDLTAVQSMHTVPTARVGGLTLVAGILTLFLLSLVIGENTTNLLRYLVCIVPLFVAGFAEDLGHHISPHQRMNAAVMSGALVIFLFELVIDRSGIAPLDAALAITPLAIVCTLFATTGITNAFNLIDGLNGLAAFTALGVTVALSLVAQQVGQPKMAQTIFFLAPLLVGFLLHNYPYGNIFLGDAGAYLIGFTLAWLAVALYSSESAVSPFAIILIFFWPVADTLLAIWRRSLRGSSTVRPDRLHFHQLVMRWIILKTDISKRVANPASTLALLPLVFFPQAIGVLTWDNFRASLAALIALSFLFVASYLAGIRSAQRYRPGVSTHQKKLNAAE